MPNLHIEQKVLKKKRLHLFGEPLALSIKLETNQELTAWMGGLVNDSLQNNDSASMHSTLSEPVRCEHAV